ncbi:MAG: ComF family protein [bacterium]|nr:ComF family protein [bacterium]
MFLDKLLNLIFPPLCLNCGKSTAGFASPEAGSVQPKAGFASPETGGEVLCAACSSLVKLNQTLFCGKCGLRLASGKKICHQDYPYLLGSAADYGAVMKSLIHGLKFRFIKKAAEPLGKFLIRYTEGLSLPVQKFVVVPIPLSGTRLRERGFNQSELVAKIFADHFNLALETKLLLRVKNTKPQSETRNLVERKENIKECFAVITPEYLRGKNIILIDDVTTSGATLFEAAKVLKSAGVRKILALTVAKA